MAVVKTLQEYDIAIEDVIVFDTDNAAYMLKAYQRCSEVTFPPFYPYYLHDTHYECDWRCLHRVKHLYDVLQSNVLNGRETQEKIPVLLVWQNEWQ